MSRLGEFYRSIARYCDRYGVSRRDRLRLLAHYPFFKLLWLSRYGSESSKRIANPLCRLFARYELAHRAHPPTGRAGELRIAFRDADMASFQEIFWGEAYRPLLDLARIGSLVDLGGNTGMASLFFLLQSPRLERLLIVEPNPDLIPVIRSNLRSFLDDPTVRIDLESYCVSDGATEWVEFSKSDDHRLSGIDAPRGVKTRVPNTRLSTLLDRHALEGADLLKMDIEGAEHAIIAAEPEVFSRFRSLCAEIHGPPSMRESFLDRLAHAGFTDLVRLPGGPVCETVFARRVSG